MRLGTEDLLQIVMDPDLDRDTKILSAPPLSGHHHVSHQLWFPHKTTSDPFLYGPRLRTTAVEINAIAIRLHHFGRLREIDRRVRSKLDYKRSILKIGGKVL